MLSDLIVDRVCKDRNELKEAYQDLNRQAPGTSVAFGHGTWQGCYRRYSRAAQAIDLRGKTVLDVGCATGWLVPFVVGAGAKRYLGIDIVPDYIAECRERWSNIGDRVQVTFNECGIEDFSGNDEYKLSFDAVYMLGCLSFYAEPAIMPAIEKAWGLATEVLAISLPYNSIGLSDDFLLKTAEKITSHVVLNRAYWGPDQMVFLYKD